MEHSADHARSDAVDADTASARDVDKILDLLKRALSSTPLTDDHSASTLWNEHAPAVSEGERLYCTSITLAVLKPCLCCRR